MSVAWSTIENAIRAWVVTGSGLAESNVIWSEQPGNRPDGQFIDISLALHKVGQDWVDTEDSPTPSAGNEILFKARGMRELVVTLRCFGGSHRGSGSSRSVLDNVMLAKNLPSIHDALVTAKVGVLRFGDILTISEVINSSVWEPRSTLDIYCSVVSETSESGTYISKVSGTNEIADPDTPWSVDGGV